MEEQQKYEENKAKNGGAKSGLDWVPSFMKPASSSPASSSSTGMYKFH